jgi:hypothetical protein
VQHEDWKGREKQWSVIVATHQLSGGDFG